MADAPVANYEGKPVTKGSGRFGPFIKWNDLYINVPRRYNFNSLSQDDINELIRTKLEKEANRYVRLWEAEKIAIENGRWGPFIRFGKKMLKLGKTQEGKPYTSEQLAEISLDEVKSMIEAQEPGAFDKKTKAAAPKATAKAKTTATKARTATKKPSSAKTKK